MEEHRGTVVETVVSGPVGIVSAADRNDYVGAQYEAASIHALVREKGLERTLEIIGSSNCSCFHKSQMIKEARWCARWLQSR